MYTTSFLALFSVLLLLLFWLRWLPQLDATLQSERFFFKSNIEDPFLVLYTCKVFEGRLLWFIQNLGVHQQPKPHSPF